MTHVAALSPRSQQLTTSGVWVVEFGVYDADGYLTGAATPVVTVTSPSAAITTPTVDDVSAGVYRVAVEVGVGYGRWTALAVADDYGSVDFTAWVETTGQGLPTAAEMLDPDTGYLRDSSWTEDDVDGALAAEAAAQRACCRIRANYPADLAEALRRRVVVNLARRAVQLGVAGDAQTGAARYLPRLDPEVRRLEGPHRKLTVG